MKNDPWTLTCIQLEYLRTSEPHPKFPNVIRGRVFIDGKWTVMQVKW